MVTAKLNPLLHRYFLLIVGLLFLLILNPMSLLLLKTSFDTYDLQRIIQLLLLFLISIHLSINQALRAYAVQYLENILSYRKCMLAGILGLAIFSALHATYPLFGLVQVATFFLLLLFALYVASLQAYRPHAFYRQALNWTLICFGICALTALAVLMAYHSNSNVMFDPNAFINLLSAPGYMNRRFFDDAVVLAIPLLCSYFFITQSFSKKLFIFCLLSFLVARGILSGSRIYVYEPLALFILLPSLFRKKAFPYLCLLGLTFLCGFMLYHVLYHNLLNIQGIADGQFSFTNPNRRLLLWQLALTMIKAHPWLGVGPLHYPVYAFMHESYAAHPHDFILAFTAEIGIPAAVLILFLSTSAYFGMLKKAYQEPHMLAMGLVGAITGALIMSLVDGLILMPPGQIMFAGTIGLALAWHRGQMNPETLQVSSPIFHQSITGLSLLSWFVLLITLVPLVLFLPIINFHYLASCHFQCTLSPNYWSQGFIQFYHN